MGVKRDTDGFTLSSEVGVPTGVFSFPRDFPTCEVGPMRVTQPGFVSRHLWSGVAALNAVRH